MADDDMPVDEEHFDSIPWSSLLPQTQERPWLVYVAAGAVVALVVGVLAARSLRTAAPGTDPVETVTTLFAAPTASSPPTSRPISEADLRAEIQPGVSGSVAAAMRAEWFVTDYFTRDGAGGRDAELAGALGRLPPEVSTDVTTYVEWARAWETVTERDGRYRVSVAFRAITATDAGFTRGLVHGVAVRVQVGPEGGTRVVDLPEPVDLPVSPTLAELPTPGAVPDQLADQATDIATGWGEDATVLEGTEEADTWRILVEVADEHGTVWPLIVWLDAGDQP
ncbi:MAG: hypothetical protein GY773_19905 [Actinomycetia bacterium]|nr:hypothetical protein [Actinomycetes bacterium]